MRQVVLDTETTGLSPAAGHRVIEIGCVELVNRRLTGRTFHTYLQPSREVDVGAMRVHGITNEFLKDKPKFSDIMGDFKLFIQESELIIHNASFDIGFLQSEFARENDPWEEFEKFFSVIDTLVMARQKHPGQKNNLDALCKRYNVDNQHRDKHGALLDAEILAKVYLMMTGGQDALSLEDPLVHNTGEVKTSSTMLEKNLPTIDVPLLQATEEEIMAHQKFLEFVEKKGKCKAIFNETK